MLTDAEKDYLLGLARRAVEAYIRNGEVMHPDSGLQKGLEEQRGAFVTLKQNGMLRGCIGVFTSDSSLAETVAQMARAAATEDPRFDPLVPEEIDTITIEISALTPLKMVSDVSAIQVGKHGLYLTRGFQKGVLLPQVATEYGLDKQGFLEETCYKAGMEKDCWKDPNTVIEVFEAEVFSEDKG